MSVWSSRFCEPDTISNESITYQNVKNKLSIIWSSQPDSVDYIRASDWIDHNMSQILLVVDKRSSHLIGKDRSNSTEMVIMEIFKNIKIYNHQPKWMVILETLFKTNLLEIQTLEPTVLSNCPGKVEFRQMMIYFRILVNSLELENPCQAKKWELPDFVERVDWVRTHASTIMRISSNFDPQYSKLPKLDQIVFLTNLIFKQCSDTEIIGSSSLFNKRTIHKTGNDHWCHLKQ